MKFSLSIALLALFGFTSCEIDEPPRRTTRTTTSTRYQGQTAPRGEYPPPPQPFPQDPAMTEPTAPPTEVVESQTAPAPTVAPTTTAKGDYPYGVPVPGKPGFVRSPYSPDKMTDVRGYAPGTEVKDPYTQKIFLVP